MSEHWVVAEPRPWVRKTAVPRDGVTLTTRAAPKGSTYLQFTLGQDVPALFGCGPDDKVEILVRPIADGEMLDFVWCEDRGWAEVTFRDDGSFEVHGLTPSDWTVCWVPFDNDTVSDTLETLAECSMKDALREHEQRYDVQFLKWSDGLPHRFDAAAGAFVPLAEGGRA